MRRLSASLAEWNVVLKVIVIKLVFDEVFHNTPFYIDMKMIMRNIFFVNSFTMPTDNNTNLGFTPCFWLILRYAHGLYGKVLSRSRALSYPKNTTENLLATENGCFANRRNSETRRRKNTLLLWKNKRKASVRTLFCAVSIDCLRFWIIRRTKVCRTSGTASIFLGWAFPPRPRQCGVPPFFEG